MKSNSKKYISTTACVKCNKGSQPTYLKVEDHTQVGNNYVVTETVTCKYKVFQYSKLY